MRAHVTRFSCIITIILLWQLLALFGSLNTKILPPPIHLLNTIKEMALSGEIWLHILFSLKRVIIGFTFGLIAGIFVGVLLGVSKKMENQLNLVIELLRPVPPIAWIPIAILWFGIGDKPAYFIVAVGSFFPVFINTFKGIRFVNPAYIRAANCLGADKKLLMTDILLPSALPYIITGLRIGIGIAWTSVIAAELVGAQSGLGYMIQLNRILLQTDKIIVGMAMIGCIGYLMNMGLLILEKKVLIWIEVSNDEF